MYISLFILCLDGGGSNYVLPGSLYPFDSLYNCEDSYANIQIREKDKAFKKNSVHLGEKLQLSLIINYKQTQNTKLLITINV